MTQQPYQQPQGGYQPPQGGYQQPQGGYQQGGGQQRTNSGFDNHVEVQMIGRLTKDPESKVIGNAKVASSKIAINHRSEKAGTDFWFIEVWGNEGADSRHNFLVNHCPKGRRVFIKGTPELRQKKEQDGSYSYFPTIKVTEIIGLDGGNKPGEQQGGQQQQQQGGYQQPPAQGNFPPQQQQQQGGYPPQQQQGGFPPQAPPPGGYNPPPAPPQGAPGQQPFPPNVGGYGAPAGPPPGAPNGGYPQR